MRACVKPSSTTTPRLSAPLSVLHRHAPPLSFCKWKRLVSYWDVSAADGTCRRVRAGWSHTSPSEALFLMAGLISVYSRMVDSCRLEEEDVLAKSDEFFMRLNQPMDRKVLHGGSRSPWVGLQILEYLEAFLSAIKQTYGVAFRSLEWLISSWDGGRGLRKTQAWRGPCRLFSKSSELHLGSGTPLLRAEETPVGNGQYLSSSLHNHFLTSTAERLQNQMFQLKKRGFG